MITVLFVISVISVVISEKLINGVCFVAYHASK